MAIASLIMIAGMSQAVFLGALLLVHRRGPVRANRVMGWFLLSIAAEIFVPLQFLLDGWTGTPHAVLVLSTVPFVHGPLLLCYVRLLTEPDYTPTWRWSWHLLPMGVNLALLAPALGLDPAGLAAAMTSAEGATFWSYLMAWLKLVSLLLYAAASLYLLRRHRRCIKQQMADLGQHALNWLRLLIPSTLGLALLLTAMALLSRPLNIPAGVLDMTFAVGRCLLVFLAGWMGLRQPEVFSGPLAGGLVLQPAERSLNLSRAQVERYLQTLRLAEQQQRFYLEPDLTIGILAERLDIPSHHLSHLLNAELGVNFFNYINGLRIEEVKRRLRETSPRPRTILEIALDAGFNNKTSFNKAFRELAGITPSQYRRSHCVDHGMDVKV